MSGRACIYARISKSDDESVSIERQFDSCRALCADRGFEVVHEAEEQLSAWRSNVQRPEWNEILAEIREGTVDVLVAYRLDRLSRTVAEALKLLALLKESRCALVLYSGQIDTSSAQGEAFYTIASVFGQLEAATISERTKAAFAALAKKGKMHTGRRCFGYDRDGSINKMEAKILHQAADRLIKGESLRSVTRWLNGVCTTTAGNAWQTRSVKQLLFSPRLRGVRVHHGQLYPGTWKPIFTDEKQTKLIAALDGAKAYWASQYPYGEHLLSGLAVCGLCGSKLVHGKAAAKNGGRTSYICKPEPDCGRCGKISIREALLDQYVTEAVRYYGETFVKPKVARLIKDTEAEIKNVKTKLTDITTTLDRLQAEQFRVGKKMSPERYASLADPLYEAKDEVTAELERLLTKREALPVAPSFLKGSWWKELPGATIAERRQYLRKFLEAVIVHPAKVPRGPFDSSRIELAWQGGEHTTDLDLLHAANEGIDDAEEWNRYLESAPE